jgi:UDP-N-acetylmuramoyl-tripeptide--D-alanyl-D-alanine ligase
LANNRDNNLWNSFEFSLIFNKKLNKNWICNSIEIDSRKIKPGSIFFAMPGTKLDGHNFLLDAIKLGAESIIIKKKFKTKIDNYEFIEVDDVHESLNLLAKASRKRINNSKNIIAITGSSGKTSTKEMIGKAFTNLGLSYMNPESYNNHVGVPYSLANMPRNIDYGVFEIGMNNFNEISVLSKLVKPNIVIITNISEAHIGNFNSIYDIIKAKAEIFDGLKNNGFVLLNNDHEYHKEINKYINKNNTNVITYGMNKNADIRLIKRKIVEKGQAIIAEAYGKKYHYSISLDGEHQAINSLVVIGVLLITKCNINKGLKNLFETMPLYGRGSRHNLKIMGKKSILIDDSYNANLSSMRASIKSLDEIAKNNRKVLIFGEMGELGIFSNDLHNKLYKFLINFNISLVIFLGNKTKNLYNLCKSRIECTWSENVYSISKEEIFNLIKPKDYILIKGSRHMKMEVIVEYLLKEYKGK